MLAPPTVFSLFLSPVFSLLILQSGVVINIIIERYSFGWRVSVAIEILIGLVLALGALFLYETPRYLIDDKCVQPCHAPDIA